MTSHGGATTAASDHSSKPKKPKSREVSSRFLSPISTHDHQIQSPSSTILSPLKQNPRSSTDSRKHRSLENSGFLRGLWPSSSSVTSPKLDTLADCIGNDRLKELEDQRKKSDKNSLLLNRQRSCTEFGRFQNEKKINSASSKENHNPIFGGSSSMRYTGKLKFPRKSSKSSNTQDEDDVLPGRFSVDENSLRKKSSSSRWLSDSDYTQDSESEHSDVYSSFDTPVAGKDFPASYMAPTVSSRKHGVEVSSKFMHDPSSRSRRWSSDTGLNQKPGNDDSPKIFSLKNDPKKGHGNWALSPGRAGPKPPTSPSRVKGRVGNILSLGIELLKGKKSSSSCSSPLGPGRAEIVHQTKLLLNRSMQWRYSNARGEAVNQNNIKHAERKILYVRNSLIKLQHSVVQKKLQLQKENLEFKLNYILHSQIKALEKWGNMERQHSSAVSTTTDYLHSVICRIPLIDGAKVEPQSTGIALRHASDLAESVNMMLTSYSTIEETVGVSAELAMVVIQEKQLLEECLELFRHISVLEIQERSLKSSIMQLSLLQQQEEQMLA